MAKRNHKSIYYDRYTGKVDKATNHASRPRDRPHRYMFVGHFFHVPSIYSRPVVEWMRVNKIRPKQILVDKDLPF